MYTLGYTTSVTGTGMLCFLKFGDHENSKAPTCAECNEGVSNDDNNAPASNDK